MFADPYVAQWFPKFTMADIVDHYDLPATERAADHSTYSVDDFYATGEKVVLFTGHQFAKRERVTARFTISKVIADPMSSVGNLLVSSSYYVVADRSPLFLPTSETAVIQSLASFMVGVDSGVPPLTRLMAGET